MLDQQQLPGPGGGAEELHGPIRGQELGSSQSLRVNRQVSYGRSPPFRESTGRKTKTQSKEDQAESVADIESTGHDVCVSRPPALVLAHDPNVEEGTDKKPVREVPEGGGGDHTTNAEDGREVNISLTRVSLLDVQQDVSFGWTYGNTAGVSPSDEVVNDCAHSSDHPEPVDPRKQGARAKHSLRTDNSPNDTSVVEGRSTGACEALRLVFGAELGDVTNEEVEGSDLNNRQPDDGKELGAEHGSRRYFHLWYAGLAIGFQLGRNRQEMTGLLT